MKKVFSEAFSIFKKNFATVLTFIIVIILPLWAIQFFCVEKVCDIDNAIEVYQEYLESDEAQNLTDLNDMPAEVKSAQKKVTVYYLLSLVITVLGVLEECCVVKITIKQKRHPQEIFTVGSIMNEAAAVYPKAVIAELLVCVICIAGLTFFILPGIYFYIVLGFTTAAAVFCGSVKKGLKEGIKAFKYNAKGAFLTLIFYRLVPLASSLTLSYLIVFSSGNYVLNLVISIAAEITASVIGSYASIAAAVFFLDNTDASENGEEVGKSGTVYQ